MYNSESNEAELVKRIKEESKCIEDFRVLGKIYFDRGDYKKHVVLCDETLELSLTNDERAIILSEKGESLNILNKREEAILCFEQSLILLVNEKETPDILYIKGMNHYNLLLYSNDKKRDEYACQAFVEFKELLKNNPDYEKKQMANSTLAFLYCRNQEFDKAIEMYEEAVATCNNDDDKVLSLSGIASVYSENGDYKQSEEVFEKALDLAKDKKYYSKLYFDVGEMYFNSNRPRDAIDAFNNALNYKEYTPSLKDDKEYIAEICWYLGTLEYNYNCDFNKTIGFLSKTLEYINKDHIYYSDSHITLGHCYLAKEDYDKAKEHYNVVKAARSITDEQNDMVNKCLKEIETKGKGSDIGSFFSRKKK